MYYFNFRYSMCVEKRNENWAMTMMASVYQNSITICFCNYWLMTTFIVIYPVLCMNKFDGIIKCINKSFLLPAVFFHYFLTVRIKFKYTSFNDKCFIFFISRSFPLLCTLIWLFSILWSIYSSYHLASICFHLYIKEIKKVFVFCLCPWW